ncbi:hypothetical protein [Cribrihabitans pelagius]|uniref:hypothetical protein n=1 Tax=Cribrihabitans pelagius TaxID=1765746 RepID=UPI003B5C419C
MQKYTYGGLLDDVIQRFDPIAGVFEADFFTRQLIKSALFGYPIIINDGYLFASDGFDQLSDEKSLLWGMIRTGFAQVITKTGELDVDAFVDTPERMSARGMASNEATLARPDYAERKAEIKRHCGFFDEGGLRAFPPFQMDAGFRKLFARLKGKSIEDLGLMGFSESSFSEIFDRIVENEKYAEFPRQTVEDTLEKAKSERLIVSDMAVRSLMSIACQAYHYNFAMCLSHSMGQDVGAETTIGRSFEDLLGFSEYYEVDPLRAGLTPLIGIPQTFPRDRLDIFLNFTVRGTRIYKKKWEFLNFVKSAVSLNNRDSIGDLEKDLEDAFRTYASAIAAYMAEEGISGVSLLSFRERSSLKIAHSLVAFGVGEVGGRSLAVFSSLAPTIKSALGKRKLFKSVAASVANISQRSNSALIERALRPQSFRSPNDGNLIYLEELTAAHSSVGFSSDAALKHTVDLPRFGVN